MGKISEDSTIAAVLAAIVGKHSPDWDQMETWDNGSGGYIGATLLAGDLGTASDPDLSVVRTLVADVDENGRVLSGYLVEFVSATAQESQFKEYVGQWLAGDFGNKPMLVAEYTVGYASTQAFFYAPGKDPRPITMRLMEKSSPGKTEATWYCWVSDAWEIEVCDPIHGPNQERQEPNCRGSGHVHVEITCVLRDDDGGYSGGGCPECGDTGGSGGGDDDDDEANQFALDCPASVTRGVVALCSVTVTNNNEPVAPSGFKYIWSSGLGASESGYGKNTWGGTATTTTSVSVQVKTENWNQTEQIKVEPRSSFEIGPITSPITYDRALGKLGNFNMSGQPPITLGIIAGSGPRKGNYMTGDAPQLSGSITIHGDFDGTAGPYPGARGTCQPASNTLPLKDTLIGVNTRCGTLTELNTYGGQVLAHEQAHQKNVNDRLAGPTGREEIEDMEELTGENESAL